MIRTGKVVKEEGKGVMVCFERLQSCEGCGCCGQTKRRPLYLSYGQAKSGDIVEVEMPDAQVLKASIADLSFAPGWLDRRLVSRRRHLSGNKDWAMVLGGLLGLCVMRHDFSKQPTSALAGCVPGSRISWTAQRD